MTTHRKVSFFSDSITIRPHTSSSASWLGRPVTLAQFAAGQPISLERIEDGPNAGEYIARRYGFLGQYYGVAEHWIQGPEEVTQ
jgi:hypothetical protein